MSERKRVVYVLNAFVKDAPNAVIVAAGRGLAKAGWDVMYVAWSRGGPLQGELEVTGVRAVVLGKGLIANAAALCRIIADFKPMIVHGSLARPTIGIALTRLFCKKRNIAWIASDHGVHEWREKGSLAGLMMERIMPTVLSAMDAVVTVSDSAAADLYKAGLNESQVRIIPNGVDICRFYPRPKAMRREVTRRYFPSVEHTENIFLIGTAGNLRPLKGFDLLIRSFHSVTDHYPQVRLVIWGEGPERRRVEEEADKLFAGSQNPVCLAGYEPELEHMLPLLDLYIQPSRTESFGMAAAEAMACRVPVIVSDAGGLPMLVQHQKSGLVFQSDDAAMLSEHIEFMIENKLQRLHMAREGRLRVLHHFTQQRMVNGMKAMYEELIEENRIT